MSTSPSSVVTTAAGDSGVAVLLALIATLLLSAIGLGLVTMSSTELAIAAHHHRAHAGRLAAEAALERALVDVGGVVPLSNFLSGASASSMMAASLTPVAPWGGLVDLGALTAGLQAGSDAGAAWGANNPRWRLMLAGPFDALVTIAGGGQPVYVAVWIADDPSESDGDPGTDTNGIVLLTARACGPYGRRHTVAATVVRDGGVRVLSWREVSATAW